MNEQKLRDQAQMILSGLSRKERIALLFGADVWHTKAYPQAGLAPVCFSDGTAGVRRETSDSLKKVMGGVLPATCFPSLSTLACSFDRNLLYRVGRAIAEECIRRHVDVLLGPGINLQRHPCAGRNFEYFSEDPFLTGELGLAWTRGVQERGVGVCVKHFALNNREYGRLVSDSVLDERTMRELYLRAFETIVKKGRPWAVMCSYNKFRGQYISENSVLLTDILRKEWGYKGPVISDWGAVVRRVPALQAGLDLEMPRTGRAGAASVLSAERRGTLPQKTTDRAAGRIITLSLKAEAARKQEASRPIRAKAWHHTAAREAAEKSIVLLQNRNGLLPLAPGSRCAVIGAPAKESHYQGNGSSRVHPRKTDSAWDALAAAGLELTWAEGYRQDTGEPDENLIAEAALAAEGQDAVLVFAGLSRDSDAEAKDRADLSVPPCMTALIRALAEAHPHVAVILSGGAPMDVSWRHTADAVVYTGLSGEAGGSALAEILTGRINPSGKLAASWPEQLSDVPSSAWFPGSLRKAEYREGLFVGYRYYDAADVSPAFPFGFGLSYTEFSYQDLTVSKAPDGSSFALECLIRNEGSRIGTETVQLYLAPADQQLFHAPQSLRGFARITLGPGQSGPVSFTLTPEDAAYWNVRTKGWYTEKGRYEIRIGASSRDIRLRAMIDFPGKEPDLPYPEKVQETYASPSAPFSVDDETFNLLLKAGGDGARSEPKDGHEWQKKPHHTMESTVTEIRDNPVGRAFSRLILGLTSRLFPQDRDGGMAENMVSDMPLHFLANMTSQYVPKAVYRGLVKLMNLFSGDR